MYETLCVCGYGIVKHLPMSLSSEENVITEILTLIKYVRTQRDDIPDPYAKDVLETVLSMMCRIMSMLLAKPINGKLIIRAPVEYTDHEEQAESIQRNLVDQWA